MISKGVVGALIIASAISGIAVGLNLEPEAAPAAAQLAEKGDPVAVADQPTETATIPEPAEPVAAPTSSPTTKHAPTSTMPPERAEPAPQPSESPEPVSEPAAAAKPARAAVLPVSAPVSSSSSGDRDCGDFGSQGEAQRFFVANGGPSSDPHKLDRDHDGVACESL